MNRLSSSASGHAAGAAAGAAGAAGATQQDPELSAATCERERITKRMRGAADQLLELEREVEARVGRGFMGSSPQHLSSRTALSNSNSRAGMSAMQAQSRGGRGPTPPADSRPFYEKPGLYDLLQAKLSRGRGSSVRGGTTRQRERVETETMSSRASRHGGGDGGLLVDDRRHWNAAKVFLSRAPRRVFHVSDEVRALPHSYPHELPKARTERDCRSGEREARDERRERRETRETRDERGRGPFPSCTHPKYQTDTSSAVPPPSSETWHP